MSATDLIARLENLIHNCLKDYVVPEQPLAIVDFPDIHNRGDSAIWVGEMTYLRNRFGKRPDYVSRIFDFSTEELEKRVPAGPIFIHGGGNFGDIWLPHQDFREALLERFPKRQVVQLPQSIHYGSLKRAEQTARIIDRHGNFVLLVRDEESHDFARRHFNCPVRLCPDMAFAIGPLKGGSARLPVLAMLREDVERACDYDPAVLGDIPREDWIDEPEWPVKFAKAKGAASALLSLRLDEIALRKLDAAASDRLRRGIAQISKGRAIVTDRLHVHICSILIGRPHAVLDNSYGKIRRFMDAFSGGSSLTFRAASLAEAVDWARSQA